MSNERQIQRADEIVVKEAKPRLKRPSLYKVILINDDFTPMEFVIIVLEQIFRKPRTQAMRIMLSVHQQGAGVCGIFPAEIAEMKVRQVMQLARDHQHPLQCTMEPE